MTVADLIDLYQYGTWANEHVLRAAADLSPEELTRSVAGSYGSVRNTLVHALSAQWGWVAKCGGPERGPALQADDFPTVQALAELMGTVQGHTFALLDTLDDADLDRTVTYPGGGGEPRSMQTGELLFHAANHAVHHRGQVALLLRELGRVPGNFDSVFYHAERRGVEAW